MTIRTEGIIPPLVTPFAKDGSINENMFRKIINNVIGKGVHGVFVAGSQGEFFSLERQERIRLFEVAVEEVNGKVPVYAGTAAATTSETVLLTKAAKKSGCDAVSATANVAPKLIVDLYNHVKSGNYEAARQAQFDLIPLRMAFSLGSFPVVIKEALSILGFDTGGARAPIQSLTPENHRRLVEVLKKMGLVK